MEYILLEKFYYINKKIYENEYYTRFNSISTVKLNIDINKNQAFFVVTPELLNKITEINSLNQKLNKLTQALPGIALNQYIKKCLIDEIVLTNEIEGVISTRRDISEILEDAKCTKTHKRLMGLVNKYELLNSDDIIEIRNCQDIRDLYDELLKVEISMDNPQNQPDGVYFRKNGVDVKNQFQKVIHEGLMPEDNINRAMLKALDILNDEQINPLVRIAIFHYLFGYIHPFYDGNGRVSRFISSYLLSKNLNILTGYRLAVTVKENIYLYYKSFKYVNEFKNKGDLTPFILNFMDIIIKSLDKLCFSLSEKVELINYYYEVSQKMSVKDCEQNIIFALFQETLFGINGISVQELATELECSEYYVRQVIKKYGKLLRLEKLGKKWLYSFDLEAVLKMLN